MLSVAMHETLHHNHILTLQRKREIHGFFNYIFATPGSCEVKNGQMPGCPELAACLKYGKRLKPKVSNSCANIPHFTKTLFIDYRLPVFLLIHVTCFTQFTHDHD